MNDLINIIKQKETEAFVFRPSQKFYDKIGINQKRFRMILKNKLSPTLNEMERITAYFDCKLNIKIEQNKS